MHNDHDIKSLEKVTKYLSETQNCSFMKNAADLSPWFAAEVRIASNVLIPEIMDDKQN